MQKCLKIERLHVMLPTHNEGPHKVFSRKNIWLYKAPIFIG